MLEEYDKFVPPDPIKPLDLPWELIENKAARYWWLRPRQFRKLDAEERAELMATYIVDQQVDGYYNSEQSKRVEKIRKEHQADPALHKPKRHGRRG